MSTKTATFIHQSLAATGFALLDSQMAYLLRPELWPSGQDCAMDCGAGFKPEKLLNIERVTRMTAMIEGRKIPVLARSTINLAERIELITGAKVQRLEQANEAERPAPAAPRNYDDQLAESQRLEQLRKLAAQEPPANDCALRKDILAAQAELARLGVPSTSLVTNLAAVF